MIPLHRINTSFFHYPKSCSFSNFSFLHKSNYLWYHDLIHKTSDAQVSESYSQHSVFHFQTYKITNWISSYEYEVNHLPAHSLILLFCSLNFKLMTFFEINKENISQGITVFKILLGELYRRIYCRKFMTLSNQTLLVCLFVWFLTTHQPLWVISVRRY